MKRVISAALLVAVQAACPSPGKPCSDTTDCEDGEQCLLDAATGKGQCKEIPPGKRAEGEGEGEPGEGEGEGDPGEGEGEGDPGEGEGEGDPGEGEGEGDPAEGEGEGDPGEGEGEGDPGEGEGEGEAKLHLGAGTFVGGARVQRSASFTLRGNVVEGATSASGGEFTFTPRVIR